MLGEKLKEQRMSLGLTQQEVAEHLHVSRQTISNWEVGRNFPDIPMIISISDYYHISLDELLKGDEQLMDKMKKDRSFSNALSGEKSLMGYLWEYCC